MKLLRKMLSIVHPPVCHLPKEEEKKSLLTVYHCVLCSAPSDISVWQLTVIILFWEISFCVGNHISKTKQCREVQAKKMVT